jgi:signal transduction histidine kinase
VKTGGKASVADLRSLRELADLPEDVVAWLAERGELVEGDPGERLFTEGDPADHMFAMLSGALQLFTKVGGQALLFDTFRTGRISGVLPYSRITSFSGYGLFVEPSRVFRLGKPHFPEMLQRSPELGQRLVAIMSDRVRDSTRTEEQREKMMALGKLAAGLAHELNNPAAAVRRSASSLRERLETMPSLVEDLLRQGIDEDAIRSSRAVLARVRERPAVSLSTLERGAKEDELSDWLEVHGVPQAWDAAEALVEAGFGVADLDALAAVGKEKVPPLLAWLAATIESDRLTQEIAAAAARISELVGSVKTYSHLDHAPDMQPTDVRQGIDSTLIMLGHELKAKAIRVVREDAKDLPLITAHPGELNQVWTNLIDNAVDALPAGGELRIETAREAAHVVVRVIDNGSGIPTDIQTRIFEPFFTTKGVGDGTGLGLDIVQRIVRQHAGQIDVESQPGRTAFTVRLPLAVQSAATNHAG